MHAARVLIVVAASAAAQLQYQQYSLDVCDLSDDEMFSFFPPGNSPNGQVVISQTSAPSTCLGLMNTGSGVAVVGASCSVAPLFESVTVSGGFLFMTHSSDASLDHLCLGVRSSTQPPSQSNNNTATTVLGPSIWALTCDASNRNLFWRVGYRSSLVLAYGPITGNCLRLKKTTITAAQQQQSTPTPTPTPLTASPTQTPQTATRSPTSATPTASRNLASASAAPSAATPSPSASAPLAPTPSPATASTSPAASVAAAGQGGGGSSGGSSAPTSAPSLSPWGSVAAAVFGYLAATAALALAVWVVQRRRRAAAGGDASGRARALAGTTAAAVDSSAIGGVSV